MPKGRTKIEFQQFHDAYGKAYGSKVDRIAAERAWKRLSDKDKRAAIAGITLYHDYCQAKGVAMAYPGKYLNLHRWEIEMIEDVGTKAELSQTSKPKFGASMLGQMNVCGRTDGLTMSAITVQEPATGGSVDTLSDMDTW